MLFTGFFVLATCLSAVSARPTTNAQVSFKKQTAANSRWEKQGKASAAAMIPMTIALAQQNLEQGPQYLQDISDPTSANYGKHWSAQKVRETFAPSEESTNTVKAWLTGAGISKEQISSAGSGSYLKFSATVDQAQSLLKTQYHIYQHQDTNEVHMGVEEFSLPAGLEQHINYIKPTTAFPRKIVKHGYPQESPIKTRDVDASCQNNATPNCIKNLYNIADGADAGPGNDLTIVEFSQSYDQADLDQFFQEQNLGIPAGTSPVIPNVDGGIKAVTQGQEGGETMLDLSVAYPIVYPQNIAVLAEDTGNLFDAIDCSYDQSGNCTTQFPATNVISISYGSGEDGSDEQASECQEFMKLGLQGVSVLVSSGDGGVQSQSQECPNGNFFVDFWASCPYVTAAGATMLDSNNNEVAAQNAGSNYASGGGFSSSFAQPSYQSDAVNGYISNTLGGTPGTQYNASGRAYPDLAALGNNVAIVANGTDQVWYGTSAAAPLVAAMITSINAQRIAAGKGPVGFLNPTLYANPSAFNDITSGNNPGCGTDGFAAAQGWDPVTGLGSPDYGRLSTVFMNLP